MSLPETLVLGATGRIGRVLQQGWQADAAPVLWQTRRVSAPNPALNWARFDPLQDPTALSEAMQGRSALLCLAGVIPGRGADLHQNTTLAEAAIRAAAGVGARVLLASSAAVYGDRAGLLPENLPPQPVSDYGRAKAEMEARGSALARKLGVELCVLRIGNIAGLDAILGGWQPGFELDVFGNGRSPRRSYIGVQSLANVLARLLAAPHLPEILNIAAPEVVEMGALLDAAGRRWTPRPAPDSAIAEVRLDTRALQQIAPVPAEQADPVQMAAQWRLLEPYVTEGTLTQETGRA
ncbi:NAD(P)-dependent oxidoreductase [Ruegeria sp. 2205SS24-7]|uniref:NAD-dependent epimerase/dehydratase family protein n=1 Tax=Ruegeria discodermiae TaxID=3064389 RepID=UPI00274040A3|nr:NAD(P)-dependent oxidoreductase [Ruegeria sp. 2205SS24-7]MDP5220680.1 NAD(P)-dependent oxidoreductase [Ruegeria sp. 2205SS24-7]